MIFFPFVYEDELLYSILARYHNYSGNENYKTTMDELFGSNNVCATTLFPSRLNELCKRLPTSDGYSTDYLIGNHTLLPYYSPFIPKERFQELKNIITEDDGTALYMKLGKAPSSIKSPDFLRYCPNCLEEDRSINGEVYWHRTHQIEGVKICPKHHVVLIESDVSYSNRKNKHELISLEQVCNKGFKVNDQFEFKHLKYIAEQTYFLLNNNISPLGLNNIKKFYVSRLQQMGLATSSGRVRWIELISRLTQYYGDNLLKELYCFVNIDDQDTWLHKLLRKPKVSCHPLRHILLLGFLNETVSSLVNNINNITYEPFGSGPWLCLNKVAEHFQTPVIDSCVITRDYKSGQPVGTFSCSCGFVFSRKGPDKESEDCYKIGRIKEFGPVWEQKLLELDPMDLSLRKKAEILGVDPMTVKNKLVTNESKTIKKTTISKRDEYRDQWIKLVQDNSKQSVTEIRSINPKIYTWLYRNDREWLNNHYPSSKKQNSNNNERVDWIKRDQDTAKKIEIIVEEILAESNKLIRVTKNEIGRRIGMLSTLDKYIDKMPQTKKVLNENVESLEQFQIRRIKYVASRLRENKTFIKEWELIRVAGLKKEYVEKYRGLIEQEVSVIN
ncbi:TnsD family transposase [Schinkia azotoformans]|uniref:Uncharacterized protein n=1 Tax=Schinkia azotoformans LMG 9581 TaxID=1131731 RepID=K6EAH2_SCHAZ|nr:TnsD family Tn7-like transposition protein [Schinkia azotoformans]EKN70401.1 hypothetical protein BAZO_01337 [Schinkia azotoformans LMG 9581]MEC1640112.1 TnsD family transposase [Schinkia azotoformans]MEC1943550.1 TnsD family transposase [Schinkia azotoformans]